MRLSRQLRRLAEPDAARARSVAELTVVASVFVAPAALGSTQPAQIAVVLALASIGLAACVADAWQQERRLVASLALAAVGGMATVVALQRLPLPPALIARLAPASDDLFNFALGPRGLYPAWRPLALDVPACSLELAKALTLTALCLTAAQLARDKHSRKRLTLAIALVGAGLAGVAYFHLLVGFHALFGEPAWARENLVTPFANRNHLASALSLGALAQLGLATRASEWRRGVVWAGVFLLTATAVLLSGSRAGALAFIGGGVVFLALTAIRGGEGDRQILLRHRLALAVCLSAGVVGVAAYLNADYLLERVGSLGELSSHGLTRIWPQAVPLVRDHWLTGIGRGAFKTVFPRYQQTDLGYTFTHPENVVLQICSELGLVVGPAALVVLAGAWATTARRPDLSGAECGLLAGLFAVGLHEFADFGLELLGVAVPTVVALSIATVRPHAAQRLPRWVGAALALATPALGAFGIAQSAHLVQRDRAEVEALVARSAPPERIADAAWQAMDRHPADYVVPLDAALAAARARPPQPERALYWAGRAMYLAPATAWPHRLAAEALFLLRKPDQALLEARLAMPVFGDDPAFGRDLARFVERPDQWASLVPDTPEGAFQALRLTDFDPKLSLAAGELCLQRLQVAPPTKLLMLLARRALDAGAHPRALELARRVEQLDPNDPAPYLAEFRALTAQHDAAGAEDALRRGLKRVPGELELSLSLAGLLSQHKAYTEAHQVLTTATAPDPRSRVRVLTFDASLWQAEGMGAHAVGALRDAAQLTPEDPQRQYDLARLFLALDRTAEALASIDRGLAIDRRAQAERPTRWRKEIAERLEQERHDRLMHDLQHDDDPK